MSLRDTGGAHALLSAGPFADALESTGYLDQGEAAPGVTISPKTERRRRREFHPDAVWKGDSSVTVYFKYSNEPPSPKAVAAWRREIWNEGFCPLLWVVTPGTIDLYNGFGRPQGVDDAKINRLRTFRMVADELRRLDELAGRLAMETGQFWKSGLVSRETGVDQQLLQDLASLEHELVASNLDRAAAQALIGRAIFTQYLVDRGIIDSALLQRHSGASSLPLALRDPKSAAALFEWLGRTFNGDMFPAGPSMEVDPRSLNRIADFLSGQGIVTGQLSLFPYQFDIIPVELISSIYERFVHVDSTGEAKDRGVHYTPLAVVSLILDETLHGATGHETVLDLTCGSGVFLVEALRRLVRARSGGSRPTREIVRTALYEQVFGVDISEAAIRVAAFSLYLAALELDPNPQPPEALTFEPLIERNLLVGDCWKIDPGSQSETVTPGAVLGERRFDVIVGNPPWTFRGKEGSSERRTRPTRPRRLSPRGEALDFVAHAIEFGHANTHYGFVVSAVPLFAASGTGRQVVDSVLRQLAPVTIVNLSSQTSWLFQAAKMPAAVLLATGGQHGRDELTLVNVPWSQASQRSRTFAIAPSDVVQVPLNVVLAQPTGLKTAAYGRGRDAIVLDRLRSEFSTLDSWLKSVGAGWKDGLILGHEDQRTRDSRQLIGLPILGKSQLEPLRVVGQLEHFNYRSAQWPRTRDIYEAPLLLVKEFLTGPRPTVAVVEDDLIFTDAYFGAHVSPARVDEARMAATILSSAVASWFLLLTSAEFGVWKRRLLVSDVRMLPVPQLAEVMRTPAGRALVAAERDVRLSGRNLDLDALDDAVFDLYHLDSRDRLVVLDGLHRASWQWKPSREHSGSPATTEEVSAYAQVFVEAMDSWLRPLGRRHMQAEVYDLPLTSPLRVARFLLIEGEPGKTRVSRVVPKGSLKGLLGDVGGRLQVRIGEALVGQRELRVHGPDEVVLVKPASRYAWTAGKALEDADAVILDTVRRGRG
jgi:hypothetical protein